MKRSEGVAIVLAGSAIRAGGSRWKAWGSRLITATSETGRGSSGHLHITSCYAPTIPASREEKDEFFDSPQQAPSAIPSEENNVVLGISMLE